MSQINYTDFKKLEMRVGTIMHAEQVARTEKLYKLMIDIGQEKPIQLVSSLVPYYTKEELAGKQIIVLTNLKPVKFGGELSKGMLLCAETKDGSKCVLLQPERLMKNGTPVT
ncbi:tRNA-binding protein [Candidatus Woesearchaeota archaeon CG_4_10_14_0_8_um_filter_47_5]|nr:MAG: tRNA-binding protein [Candidatus Woesearchaeota archaeon CG_4_10_14_0_8_um_filter_47_5]